MKHPHTSTDDRRCVPAARDAFAAGLHADDLDGRVVKKCAEDADRVRPSTDAGDHDIGKSAKDRERLLARLAPDDRLEVTHHRRVRVRADRRSEQVVRGAHVGDPVADRLVHRILQGAAPRVHLAHLGAQELHAEDVGLLTSCIDGAHVDDALDSEQGARGRARHTVLPRTGLRDDAPLAHPLGEQCLAHSAVDLVRAGVREVLALQEHAGETYCAGKTRGIGERRRPAHPVAQDPSELGLKSRVGASLEPRRLELRDRRHERLGEILAAELAVSTGLRCRDHTLTVRLIEAMPWMSGPGSSARMRAVPTSTASTRAGSIRASSTDAMPDSATRI